MLFAVMTSGSLYIARTASGESWAAVQCVLPFHTHHATEASAFANSSKTSIAAIGVRSSPPYDSGKNIRKKPACASSRAMSSGIRRAASMRSRSAMIRGRNARAASSSAAPVRLAGIDLSVKVQSIIPAQPYIDPIVIAVLHFLPER